MKTTTYIALARQATLMRKMDVIANNMANANTTSFKSDEMMFKEYLVNTRSSKHSVGDKLSFVQDVGMLRDTSEGPLTNTGDTYDVAIHKSDAYFQIETESGMRYSRNGHFRTDQDGVLVNDKGEAVMSTDDTPIIIAPNDQNISITPDGWVSSSTSGKIKQLKAVHFDNPQTLRRVGNGLYDTTADPQVEARPEMVQGMLEESNVQPVREMTNLISVTREYESTQKIIDAEGDRVRKAMQTLSGAQSAAA